MLQREMQATFKSIVEMTDKLKTDRESFDQRLSQAVEYLEDIADGCCDHRPEDGCDCAERLARKAVQELS